MNLTPREQAEIDSALALTAEPVAPSPELKAKIMAKIAQTPQLPAVTRNAVLENTAPEASSASPSERSGPGSAERRAQSKWFNRPVTILVAAAAAALLFVGGAVVGGSFSTPNSLDAEAQSLAVLTAAGDLQRATAEIAGGGEATLVWSLDQRKSAILVSDLPSLPKDKTYQLWYIGEDGPIDAGTLEATASATSWRVLDGQMSAGDAVGVTVEPAGGSPQPTTDPILKMASS